LSDPFFNLILQRLQGWDGRCVDHIPPSAAISLKLKANEEQFLGKVFWSALASAIGVHSRGSLDLASAVTASVCQPMTDIVHPFA
jgi:hypothetical protein